MLIWNQTATEYEEAREERERAATVHRAELTTIDGEIREFIDSCRGRVSSRAVRHRIDIPDSISP